MTRTQREQSWRRRVRLSLILSIGVHALVGIWMLWGDPGVSTGQDDQPVPTSRQDLQSLNVRTASPRSVSRPAPPAVPEAELALVRALSTRSRRVRMEKSRPDSTPTASSQQSAVHLNQPTKVAEADWRTDSNGRKKQPTSNRQATNAPGKTSAREDGRARSGSRRTAKGEAPPVYCLMPRCLRIARELISLRLAGADTRDRMAEVITEGFLSDPVVADRIERSPWDRSALRDWVERMLVEYGLAPGARS